ncbi:putative transcription factor WD40-like family [Helianthus annuus]|nr:putative transcription factor WD40-like family [Helianthus annuus]
MKEKTLEIEYIRAVAPRKEEDPSLHDDWVSAVDGSSRFILTGCYDGLGRIWESARVCTHDLEGHNDAVTSVGIVKTIEDEDNTVVATGSKDKCETLEGNLLILHFFTHNRFLKFTTSI